MRNIALGLLLVGVAGSAQGQAPAWGAFEDGAGRGIGVQGADGSQLILKCDKPGRDEVYALMMTQKGLVPPSQTYSMRPVDVSVDGKSPYDDNWRFYEKYVVAIDKGRERSLTRLLTSLAEAKTLELRLYPDEENRVPVTFKFDVAGAKQAWGQLFESCKDNNPVP